MSDPFLESVATALAGQAAVALGSAGKAALVKVRELLRRKSEQDQRARAALETVENDAPERAEVATLVRQLRLLESADEEFSGRLRAEGAPIHRELNGGTHTVTNQFSGDAKNVVQGERFDRIEFH
ncbi:hypothetical protein [Actinopolyspora mortivallis]|uniref:Uncharacterized protein n=1 Tax=Actinopolyspora mortivallis TaxID=33906 RepID=A0A2T0GVQ1_ACTMO|nr:hypothetical protein [Actinopolyspora mortivallis]PRW63195.1 hypothetical protein CEP50_11600 [Actinopolyspora mortivallis]